MSTSRAFCAFFAACGVTICAAFLALFCAIYLSPRTGEPLEWLYLLVTTLLAALSAALVGVIKPSCPLPWRSHVNE